MTVYVEYVLIDNILIDFLLLKATFALTKTRVGKGRLFLCSVLGAVISLTYPLIKLHTLLLTLLKCCCGLLLVLLSTNFSSFKSYYISSLIFFALTFAVGGSITGILNLLGVNNPSEVLVSLMVLPVYIVLKIVIKLLSYLKVQSLISKQVYPCEIETNGEKIKLKGFIDTGNTLFFENKPVVICSVKKALKFLSPKQLLEAKNLTCSTVTGQGRLKIVKIESLTIYFSNKEHKINNVTLGVNASTENAWFDVILHPALLEGENEPYKTTTQKDYFAV